MRPENTEDPAQLVGLSRPMANVGGAHTDVQFLGRNHSPPQPPDIILDYMYGVATYRLWRSDPQRVDQVMSTYHREHYTDIPLLPQRSPSTASETVTEGYDSDHPLDDDYFPSSDEGMSRAMDDLNLALMRISGITPQELADRRKKQAEEEEQVAQETSRRKVSEWMEHRMSHGTISSNTAHAGLSANAAYTFSSNTAYPHFSSNAADTDLSSNTADTDFSSNAAYR